MSDKVTYYREVKASERLPSENGYYNTNEGELKYYPELEAFGISTYQFQPEWWLEPIDITEEEIRKIPYQIAETFGGGLYGDYFKASKLTIEMLLSRLKGE